MVELTRKMRTSIKNLQEWLATPRAQRLSAQGRIFLEDVVQKDEPRTLYYDDLNFVADDFATLTGNFVRLHVDAN
jgi:hypothetical protein